jgi:uncharacterized damage-inducible protein DinB
MDLSYPIGKFAWKGENTPEDRAQLMGRIAALPAEMRAAIKGLSPAQLDTPYRPGGWTVRQVVHHVADSHMNAFIRFKLALTEDQPTIKPYNQAAWASLEDTRAADVDLSLTLIEGLHARWALLLRAMKPEDFARAFRHPEHLDAAVSLDRNLAMYVWHGAHHTAHITALRQREGW